MNAAAVMQAAVIAALKADTLLDPLRLFDAPPTRALVPYAVVEHPQWGALNAAGVTGRVGTLAIGFHDEGEIPSRLRVLMTIAEECVETMPSALADGWRIGGLMLARSQLMMSKEGWLGRSEWAVRVFRVN